MQVYFAHCPGRNENRFPDLPKRWHIQTTTALNLAVEAAARGLEVVLIDLDPQVSACDWKDIRGNKAPVVAATPVPHLERALKAAGDAGVDLAIVDTAGRTNDAASAAARVADLVLIPLQPSLIDLKTLGATLEIIRLAGGKPARALLTRVRAVGNRHQETAAWLEQQGVVVCPVMLGERVTYQDAYAQGLGVSETDAGGKAAEEIRKVYLYISSIIELSTRGIKPRRTPEHSQTHCVAAGPMGRSDHGLAPKRSQSIFRSAPSAQVHGGRAGRDVADMVAEALNLLFVRYRKPELAPRKGNK